VIVLIPRILVTCWSPDLTLVSGTSFGRKNNQVRVKVQAGPAILSKGDAPPDALDRGRKTFLCAQVLVLPNGPQRSRVSPTKQPSCEARSIHDDRPQWPAAFSVRVIGWCGLLGAVMYRLLLLFRCRDLGSYRAQIMILKPAAGTLVARRQKQLLDQAQRMPRYRIHTISLRHTMHSLRSAPYAQRVPRENEPIARIPPQVMPMRAALAAVAGVGVREEPSFEIAPVDPLDVTAAIRAPRHSRLAGTVGDAPGKGRELKPPRRASRL
jgi:hypothetical protein